MSVLIAPKKPEMPVRPTAQQSVGTAAIVENPARPTSWLFSASNTQKALAVYLPATMFFRLVNFGRIILLTWFMTQQQFGLLTMIFAVVSVMTPLCSLGLNEAIARYVPKHEQGGTLPGFIRQSLMLLIAITSLSVIAVCSFARPLGDFFYAQFTNEEIRRLFSSDAPDLARLSAAVTALLIVYFFLLALLKGLRMFNALCVMEIFHGTIFLGLTIAAVVIGRCSAFTMTALYGIALAIPIIVFGLGLVREIGGKSAAGRLQPPNMTFSVTSRRLLRFSIWTTLAGVAWQVLVYYPPWFLNKMQGQEAVAVFNAVRQIGQFIFVGAAAIVTVVTTQVIKTWEQRGRAAAQSQLSLAFRGTGIALLVACTIMALLKDFVVVLFKPAYFVGAEILPLQLLFFLIGAYLAFLPIHFQLIEKTRHMFWPWAVGVAANVLYALWLAGPFQDEVLRWPLWQWTARNFSWMFATGYTGPQGLDASAWCGVMAIATALICCVLLIRAECDRLDRGTYVIIGSASLLALNPWLLAGGCILLLVAAWKTPLIFSESERDRIRGYAHNLMRHAIPHRRRPAFDGT